VRTFLTLSLSSGPTSPHDLSSKSVFPFSLTINLNPSPCPALFAMSLTILLRWTSFFASINLGRFTNPGGENVLVVKRKSGRAEACS